MFWIPQTPNIKFSKSIKGVIEFQSNFMAMAVTEQMMTHLLPTVDIPEMAVYKYMKTHMPVSW